MYYTRDVAHFPCTLALGKLSFLRARRSITVEDAARVACIGKKRHGIWLRSSGAFFCFCLIILAFSTMAAIVRCVSTCIKCGGRPTSLCIVVVTRDETLRKDSKADIEFR